MLRDICHKVHSEFASRFDDLTLTIIDEDTLAIRISNSTVSRENIHKQTSRLHIYGSCNSKHSQMSMDPPHSGEELSVALAKFHQELQNYPQDAEYCLPIRPQGTFNWDVTSGHRIDDKTISQAYKHLETQLVNVRSRSLRATGHFQIQQKSLYTIAKEQVRETIGIAATVSVTVDNQFSGATGVGKATILNLESDSIVANLQSAFSHAIEVADMSENPKEIDPGNYTVILSPYAISDILRTAVYYGFFDRRKIDEKQTYLSGKLNDLTFPRRLDFGQSLHLKLENGLYGDSPFNNRGVPCDSLSYITKGKIRDLNTSPYWAKKTGLSESFHLYDGPPMTLDFKNYDYPSKSTKDLIKNTKKGIYVVDMWYLRMVSDMQGILTGMTRDGLFYIQDGEIKHPLINMRWHENPIKVLQNIVDVTEQKELIGQPRLSGMNRHPMAYMPAVAVKDFHFSSATKF